MKYFVLMLCWNVKALLLDKGIAKPLAWLRRRGMGYPVAKALLEGKTKRLSVKQMNELCLLLQCTPSDLFYWKPEPEALPAEHPLRQLEISAGQLSVLEHLRLLTRPQLKELHKLLESLQQHKEKG